MASKFISLSLRDNLRGGDVGIYLEALMPGSTVTFETAKEEVWVSFSEPQGSPFKKPDGFCVLPGPGVEKTVAEHASGSYDLDVGPPDQPLSIKIDAQGEDSVTFRVDEDLRVLLLKHLPADTTEVKLQVTNLASSTLTLILAPANTIGNLDPVTLLLAPGGSTNGNVTFDTLQHGSNIDLLLQSPVVSQGIYKGKIGLKESVRESVREAGGTRLGEIIVEGP